MRTTRRVPAFYSLRCRIGARLLRQHAAALIEDQELLKKAYPDRAERFDYMSIGLMYAVGSGTEWRQFDDDRQRDVRAIERTHRNPEAS